MPSRPHLDTAKLGQPLGMYSQGFLSTNSERTLYVAGQLAAAPDGSSVGVGDFDAQFRQVFANFGAVLEAAGMSFDHVVKFTTYLTSPELIGDFYRVRAEVFPTLFTLEEPPPNTLLVISRLVQPEFLIEVEGIAAIAESTAVVTGVAG
jgi:enamine deaminase RidA (YjgF/YER057c/UK114 family)